jgi:LemA protein
MAHERATLEAVTAARGRATLAAGAASRRPGDAEAMLALAQAESMLSGALSRLLATVEAFPQLKASGNVLALQEELASTENRIAYARQHFNDSVLEYNNKIEQFPANLLARLLRLSSAEMLQSIEAPEERRAPRAAVQ